MKLPFAVASSLELEQFVAKETGLSIVADYFTRGGVTFSGGKVQSGWGDIPISTAAKASQPLWRVPNALRNQPNGWKDWSEAGDCVIFRDRQWYLWTLEECPESLLTAYREKLGKRDSFTLEERAAFAVDLDRRRTNRPDRENIWMELPEVSPQCRSPRLCLRRRGAVAICRPLPGSSGTKPARPKD